MEIGSNTENAQSTIIGPRASIFTGQKFSYLRIVLHILFTVKSVFPKDLIGTLMLKQSVLMAFYQEILSKII